ncbi:AmmeMemoRadiSam system protein A [Azotosporobacter soli]|uniref:AmmeMemoRadiSam system protein A n=1 Tax=Azotosporobacter soli TaxID=3055040 RepID=UPI0031FF3302
MNKTHSTAVELAWAALRSHLHVAEMPELPERLPEELAGRAGVFVSLKKQGRLRGCIGTFEPTQTDVAHEIIRNAVMAATQDPRFPKVEEAELPELEISVDVLTPPEEIAAENQLDPARYGLILKSGWRKGLLLPQLEGVNTVEEQIAIVRQKAGIVPGEAVTMYRFTVVRYT